MIQTNLIATTAKGAISSTPRPKASPDSAGEPQPFRYLVFWKILTFVFRVRWKRGLLFWFRFAANPILTLRWWRFLSNFTSARSFPAPHDELLQKPLSKFLAYGMGNTERLAILTAHFTVAEAILSRDTMMSLWRGEWLEMGVINGRSETYACFIALADRCGGRHEGAFAIKLVRVRDMALLCAGRFTFVHRGAEGGYSFVVGSMQGPRNGKRMTVDATRDLSGLRPKEAILIVLQGLTIEGGTSHFLAVSQAKQPIRYRRAKRQSMMQSAIDAFWAERSAEPEKMFGFVVPKSNICETDRRGQSKLQFHTIGELFH